MKWLKGIFIGLVGLIIIFIVIIYQENKSYERLNKLYPKSEFKGLHDIKDSLEIFRFDDVPQGLVLYIQGVHGTLDSALVGPYKYRMYDVAILNGYTRSIFKIRVPVYAIMMFQVGKMAKPETPSKKKNYRFNLKKNERKI